MTAGFFTPLSVTWRVHRHPTMLVGGLRALILQAMHPLAMAGVAAHSDYKNRALDRLRRTSFYVAATTFGDRETALAAVARVKGLHKRVRGTDPVTGQIYDAADPETQLWVHCAEMHSFLCAYRALAEPAMSLADQDTYLRETAQIGALLGMPLAMIPKSKGEMRAYFARVRPKLLVSELARDAIEFVQKPPMTRDLILVAPLVRLLSHAAIALVPRYLRRLAGIERPRIFDQAVLTALKPSLYASTLPRVRGLSPLLKFQAHVVGREAVNYAQKAWKNVTQAKILHDGSTGSSKTTRSRGIENQEGVPTPAGCSALRASAPIDPSQFFASQKREGYVTPSRQKKARGAARRGCTNARNFSRETASHAGKELPAQPRGWMLRGPLPTRRVHDFEHRNDVACEARARARGGRADLAQLSARATALAS